MQATVTHVLPLTTIRREQSLPTNGRVLVRTGQRVIATDVIAEAHPNNPHLLLDIARKLDLAADAADQMIQRKIGERVIKDDVIAGPAGVLNRRVRAPQDAVIKAIGDGQVLLELEAAAVELRAGYPGTVVQIIPDRGAIIEGTGALVQGAWGNGKFDKSFLKVLVHSPTDELTASQLDVGMRGSVVLAGYCPQVEALQAAIDLPLRGLILASMPARLVPLAQKAPFPVLLLEGFGKIAIDPIAFNVLTTNEQREVTVNASDWDHFTGTRPEVIIPLPATGQIPAPPQADIFAPGQTVRIQRAPYAGKAGTLASIKTGSATFPSGIRGQAAIVRLENGDQVTVPLANLDVIE